MIRHFRLLMAALLVSAVVLVTNAVPAFAQELGSAPVANTAPSCKAIFTQATGELLYRSNWGSPFRGQTTAEYLLSFPPLTIGFLKSVTPSQTHDHGSQTFTATPLSMRFSLKDTQNRTLLRLPCTLVIH